MCVCPHQVDFTSCPGLFCVLGIVVMVTGIITAIVLSFKYVSGEDRGAVGWHGCSWLGIPRAGAGRGFGWSPCWEAGCGVSRGRQLGISSSSSRARRGQDLLCLACCLPAPRLTLSVSPSHAGPLAPHAVRRHRGHRIHIGELTAGVGRGCRAGTGEGGIPPWSLPDALCPRSSLPMIPNLCWGTGRTH